MAQQAEIKLYIPVDFIRNEIEQLRYLQPDLNEDLILNRACAKYVRIIIREWVVSGVHIAIHQRLKFDEE